MSADYYNNLAKRVFEENKARGWWDNMDRDIYQTLMLVVTEIAEGTEGVRKDLMDTHLPHRKMEEVELADTAIRLADMAGRYGWLYQKSFTVDSLTRRYEQEGREMPEAAEHFALVILVVDLAEAMDDGTVDYLHNQYYSMALDLIGRICAKRGYDLAATIEEKLAYNRQRADHNRENRAASGGKRF